MDRKSGVEKKANEKGPPKRSEIGWRYGNLEILNYFNMTLGSYNIFDLSDAKFFG